MLDCPDAIESDFSVFHRVDDPMRLASPRYFRLVDQLEHYDGAVRAHIRNATSGPTVSAAPPVIPGTEVTTPSRGAGIAEGTPDDIAAIAAMSQNPGFPGIGYSGG